MNRRRQLAVGFFSLVIVLVLGLIVYVSYVTGSQTVVVWVVHAPTVSAGAAFESSVVQQVPIKAQQGDFLFTTKPPDGTFHFALNMSAGDIVRDNDLVPANQQVPLNLTVTGTPAVQSGDFVDVYADSSGDNSTASTTTSPSTRTASGPVLVGHALAVSAITGSLTTVLIPSRLTSYWVTVTANPAVKLYTVKTFPGAPIPGGSGGSIDTVIAFLNAGALASNSAVTGTQPAPSPAP